MECESLNVSAKTDITQYKTIKIVWHSECDILIILHPNIIVCYLHIDILLEERLSQPRGPLSLKYEAFGGFYS